MNFSLKQITAVGMALMTLLALGAGGAAAQSADDISTEVVVDSETDLEVTNDTTLAYADVTADSNLTSNVTVLLRASDTETGDEIGTDVVTLEPDSSESLEYEFADGDLENVSSVDVELIVDETDETAVNDYVTVDDLGLEEDSGGFAFPGATDEYAGIPVWAIGLAVIGGAFVYSRR